MADHLLVPMHMDVMVLSSLDNVEQTFTRFFMDYGQLENFKSAEAPPFPSTPPNPPGAGIYLHWTLPAALRQGVKQEGGSVEFPLIPNRWLVVRVTAGASPESAIKAWVLESDYLGDEQGSAYVHPTQVNDNGTPAATTVGRMHRFTQALTLADFQAGTAAFLQAVAPANPWFAMFEPGVQNVLAFYDDMTGNDDKTPVSQAELSYYVMGWYADPASDPLAKSNATNYPPANDDEGKTKWTKDAVDPTLYTLPAFDWKLYTTPDNLAASMILHAICPSVTWPLTAQEEDPITYLADMPNNVKVAVGNTAIDALAAIVRLQGQDPAEADILEAFYYKLLDKFDQPGSAEALNMGIREHWYGTSPGGTVWNIVEEEQKDAGLPAALPAPLTTEQEQALAALNMAQYELDRQSRILESMQWTLAGLWWKHKWQQNNQIRAFAPDDLQVQWNVKNPPKHTSLSKWFKIQLAQQFRGDTGVTCPIDPDNEQWYLNKVQVQIDLVNSLQQKVAAAQKAVPLHRDGQTLKLKATARPSFFMPNDPVLLVTGLGRSTNYDPAGPLQCRLPGQTINMLNVSGKAYCAGGTCDSDIHAQIPALDDPNNLLPGGAQALNVEGFFLSPRLFAINVLGGAGQADALRDGIKSAAADTAALDQRFTPPAPAYAEWKQPWIPLLLEWDVTVLKEPAYTCPTPEDEGASNPINRAPCTFDQKNWQFDGTDYTWAGPLDGAGNFDENDSSQMNIKGRTFITPQISVSLAQQLDDYVKAHLSRDPDLQKLYEDLEAIVDKLAGMDILSQRLSGLMATLVERDFESHVSPSSDPIIGKLLSIIAKLLRSQYHGHPLPFPNEVDPGYPPAWDFAPMRGTFFVINNLVVIDNFGRSTNLLRANYSTAALTDSAETLAQYFYPIAAWDMRVSDTYPALPKAGIGQGSTVERMLQLGPRTVQDSRLEFALLSNDGTDTDIDLKAGANPICGWVVPNHPNRSLALYAPDGTAWGELFLSRQAQSGGGQFVPVWQPNPTDNRAPAAVDDIPNPYVKQVLKALTTRTDNGEAIADLLSVIDESLWTIDPLGQPKDANLSVLVGRPLAIVRARLNLKLRGLPYANQDWWNTFQLSSYNDPVPSPCDPATLAELDGGVRDCLWPLRMGSQALRNDGLIGYFADSPAGSAQTYGTFYTVHLPDELKTDAYFKRITDGNYVSLRFTDDSVAQPDPAKNEEQALTMLVDPRAAIHAFSGILPVTQISIPSRFITGALQNISYVFRAGPFLTPPESVQIPQPAEQAGVWSWFDRVLDKSVTITREDGQARFPTSPPMVKEGWLTFQPNPSIKPEEQTE